MTFDCCYEVHVGLSWLLKFDSSPQVVIRSLRTVPKQIIGLNIFCKSL